MAHNENNDPLEMQEWLDAIDSVIDREGIERAHDLIEALIDKARRSGANLPYKATTAYVNTIHVNDEVRSPGDQELEYRIRSYVRWNALAMVLRANLKYAGLGGHISTFASSATLYDVGWNHFFKGPDHPDGGDLVYFQGHSSPGVYARAFLEGRLHEEDLDHYRRETSAGHGLPSYPHPLLMPGFWQFPTVSMGLGPMMAIYQARFMRYLQNRGLIPANQARVWAYLGDGEMDEPESLGAISLAAREKLDNLVFVINCNLQRLDGPVRGNGKVIQEFEGVFRGAGWQVLKVIWGDQWDHLLAKDKNGLLAKRMEEAVDGDYQNYGARDGAYTREHFFGRYPELLRMVANLTDNDIKRLNRGGHDPQKVFAAYHAAVHSDGRPTCVLAKTVKGYGMGEGEGRNPSHQLKKLGLEALKAFRDRYRIPISDEAIADAPFYKPPEGSRELAYLHERRKELGGYVPTRSIRATPLNIPPLSSFDALLKDSGERELSTTMAFVRMLTALARDKDVGKNVVPIIPDEARTFGMEGLFRQLGIYASQGQLYEPVDSAEVMFYHEDKKGQILEEGICEAGAISSFIAAGTAYANYGVHMMPFYAFYSMFGFQRIGDFVWAAADSGARGFLIGATSGRTTLAGEGLQHLDGHSHVLSSTVPTCRSYDPTYAYELAVILHDGMQRMYGPAQESVLYYVTVMNEQYAMPAMPDGVEAGIVKGMYLLKAAPDTQGPRVQLLGSGAILREVIAAAELLANDFGVAADIWSVTSFTELAREGDIVRRQALLHPTRPRTPSYVEDCLSSRTGPVVAASDYMKLFAEQIRVHVPRTYVTLGTDGFGRSDTRDGLRKFFEVDRFYVAVAALKALADDGVLPNDRVQAAIEKYGIDPEKPHPARS